MEKDIKKTDKKVFDVTDPKKVSPNSSSRPLVVTNRSIVKQDPMVKDTAIEPLVEAPSTAPPVSPSVKQITISPVDDEPKEVENAKPESDITKEVAEPTVAETPTEEAPTETAEIEETAKVDEVPAEEPAAAEPEAVAVSEPEAEESEEDKSTDKPQEKPDLEAQKAAEAEAKRQNELQKYIDSHEYFVPVDAVQHKRSVKTSIGLTILLFILSVALIDLMLDSGFIELLQKIPHTHFFRVIN
ncbi:MAG: hypothetical protein WC498_00695 [Candidatus Saccharimonadales bacterium]